MTEHTLSPSAEALLRDTDENGFLYNNSGGLKGGVAVQVRKSLVKAGLLEQRRNDSGFGDPCEAFGGDVLRITEAGRAAIGESAAATGAQGGDTAAAATSAPAAAKPARAPRENGKQAQLIAMLRQEGGATVKEIADKLGWQPHTTRAELSRLPKKTDHKPTSEKVEGRGRVYRLPAVAS